MIAMSLREIAAITGARLAGADPEATVTGPVVADSRAIQPGGLFIADGRGHEFAAAAVADGAVACLTSRELPGVPCLVAPLAPDQVADASVVALGRLARAVLERLPNCVTVGITGSSGKTGTKDLLAQVLAGVGPTVAPEASLNNELGVPLTVLRADSSTRYLVLEMGARGIGHLRYLTTVAQPRVGVVLNVGLAHVGEFGGKQQIAQAKGELVESLPPAAAGGVAVLNADDDLVRAMAGRTAATAVLVGTAADAEPRADGVELDTGGRPRFRMRTADGSADVRLQLVGRHQVGNALAVAAVALHAGMCVEDVAARLSAASRRSRWRMEVTERADGVTIINDAYNANPDSMHAAVRTLAELGSGNRRTWAVVGEMLELGAASQTAHEDLGTLAVRLNISRLLAVGEGSRAVYAGAVAAAAELRRSGEASGLEAMFVPDVNEARQLLDGELAPDDIVLVKSSRDAGLRYLADGLTAAGSHSSLGEATA